MHTESFHYKGHLNRELTDRGNVIGLFWLLPMSHIRTGTASFSKSSTKAIEIFGRYSILTLKDQLQLYLPLILGPLGTYGLLADHSTEKLNSQTDTVNI